MRGGDPAEPAPVRGHELPELDALERSSGVIVGPRRSPAAPARHEDRLTPGGPLDVLDRLLLDALRNAPCLVAFSGGRDSSAVLASAARIARREGLPDPVPITIRYEDPSTEERDWQERLIERLGLSEHHVLAHRDEADALGAGATALLARLGHYWPPGAHVTVPLLAAARGGALVTGIGGDELFSPWEHRRIALIRRGRMRPARRDVKPLVAAGLPRFARRAAWRLRGGLALPWLTDAANRALAEALAAERDAYLRPTWAASAEVYLASRYLELSRATFTALAEDAGTRLVEPFADPGFVRAVAAAAPVAGYPSRAAAMAALFGGLVPEPALRRTSKADFTEVFWGPEARRFAESWDGSGVDPSLVDARALRQEWLEPRPDFRSVVPLHAAWLESRRIPYPRPPAHD